MTNISLKPHHFVDIICSYGAGKRKFTPHHYGHAVHTISERLIKNPTSHIQIETGADDICAPCIHNVDGKCADVIDNSCRPQAPSSKQEWNLRIDLRWCAYLGIKHGDILASGELLKRIEQNVVNLFSIYSEIPKEMTEQRKEKLSKGLKFYYSLL